MSPNVNGVKGSHILNDNLHMNGAGYLLKEYFDQFHLKSFHWIFLLQFILFHSMYETYVPKQIWKICYFVYQCLEAEICNIRHWMQAHIYNSSKLCLISARVTGYQSDSRALGEDNSAFPFCFHFVWFSEG